MDARVWRSRAYSAKASIAARTIGTRTFFQLLDALERDLELERVQKRRGIVENGDVRQLNLGHGASDEFSRGFYQRSEFNLDPTYAPEMIPMYQLDNQPSINVYTHVSTQLFTLPHSSVDG